MRKNLLCVLLGVVLTAGAYGVRDGVAYVRELENRVRYLEGFIGVLDQLLRQGGLTIQMPDDTSPKVKA